MIADAVASLRDATQSLPPHVQWLAVMLAGALPFIESYYGSVLGIAAGVHPAVAIPAAVAGNMASTLACIHVARTRGKTDDERRGSAGRAAGDGATGRRRSRLARRFARIGVIGTCLTSQAILPSQITASALVKMGAPPGQVAAWQCISIALWGCGYGALAAFGVSMLR